MSSRTTKTPRRLPSEGLADVAARSREKAAPAAELARVEALPEVNSTDKIPDFADDEAAAAFWESHTLGPSLLAQFRPVPPDGEPDFPLPADMRRATRRSGEAAIPINLRLEGDTVRRVRALAARRGTKYQTLLKAFIQERLYEEEKREGLVPKRE